MQTLPEQERIVVSMFYMGGYVLKEISIFMDVPVSTVKSRLHSARQKLKERLLYMVENHLNEQAPSKDHTFRDDVLSMIQPEGMNTPEWVYYGYEVVDGNDAWSLMCAGAAGDLKTVKALLKKDPRLIHAGFWYQFPVHMAVRKGHLEAVRVLLEAGSDPGRAWFLAYAWEKMLEMAEERGFDDMKALLEAEMVRRFNYNAEFVELRDAIMDRDQNRIDGILKAHPGLAHAADTVGNNAIHWAAMTRQPDLIDYFLERGADINARRIDGYSPLEISIVCDIDPGESDYWFFRHQQPLHEKTIANHWIVPGYLLASGAEYTFCAAVALGDISRVEQFLDQDPDLLHTLGPGWCSPLKFAAQHGNIRVVETLLDRGADPNMPEAVSPRGNALIAATAARHVGIVRLLLDRAVDINQYEDSGGDSLEFARHRGFDEIADLLLERGMKTEHASGYAFTQACSDNDVDTVRTRLEADASLANDSWGFQMAAENDFGGVVDLFLEYNPDMLNQVCLTGSGIKGSTLRKLMERGLNPNRPDWLGIMPLHKLAVEEDKDRFMLWLEFGADINAIEDDYSSTPLGWAVREGKKEMVTFLLDQGADPDAAGASWAKPLAWAIRKGHVDITKLLKARGAK